MKKFTSILILSCLALLPVAPPALITLAQAEEDVTLYLPLLSRPREPGYQILFFRGSEPFSIWRIDADGNNPLQLTDYPSGTLSWSPDGMTIVYTKIEYVDNEEISKIYRMNSDGSGQVWLGERFGSTPAYSPDGAKIAFSSNQDGDYEIFVMNADGSHAEQLTHNNIDEGSPQWSPDGQKIAYTSVPEDFAINVIDADGSNHVILMPQGGGDSWPRWSPDGSKLVFVSHSSTYALDLYVINPDGSGRTQLTYSGHANIPSWSPDGTKIVFEYNGDPEQSIRTIRADGTEESILYDGGVYVAHPTWSPDGRQVALAAAIRTDSGEWNWDIYAVDVTTRFPTRLTADLAMDSMPSWSPVKIP